MAKIIKYTIQGQDEYGELYSLKTFTNFDLAKEYANKRLDEWFKTYNTVGISEDIYETGDYVEDEHIEYIRSHSPLIDGSWD